MTAPLPGSLHYSRRLRQVSAQLGSVHVYQWAGSDCLSWVVARNWSELDRVRPDVSVLLWRAK